jgi:hypothetical protein
MKPTALMRLAQILLIVLAVTTAGCNPNSGQGTGAMDPVFSVQRGHVDFVFPPIFEVPLGGYNSVMCFDEFTVLHIKGTYVTIGVPYCFFLLGMLALFFTPMTVRWFNRRLRKAEQSDTP